MKHFADIIKGVIASALVVVLAYVDFGRIVPFLRGHEIVITTNLGSLVLAVGSLFGILLYLLIGRRPLAVKNGRVDAMLSNVRLLKKWTPRNRLKKYIYSTRVSFWPSTENESARNDFRERLTCKIQKGWRVWRIWQIHNQDDLDRLLTFIKMYKQYDNYSVKCFVGKSAFIPEILSVGGRYLSVSIPQADNPRRLTTAFHFRGKAEILRWEDYFKILWEQSVPVKMGNIIYEDNIESLRTAIRE